MKESHRTKHLRLFAECSTRKTSATANSADAHVRRHYSMKILTIIISVVVLGILSCDPEPTGREMDCDLQSLYKLDYHFLKASKVFDVRTNPPTEIKNGTLEYDLGYQAIDLFQGKPVSYPYTEYFIDSIEFIDQSRVNVKIFESDFERMYEFVRDDCQIDLESPDGKLLLELTHSGEELTEKRFAIYDHKSRRVTINNQSFISDTFLFIEFRLGPFASYEEIIKQFAFDYPGKFDTIAIEQVENRSRE